MVFLVAVSCYLAGFAYRFNLRCQPADLVPYLDELAVPAPSLLRRLLTLGGTAA